jgi:uncharacterized coiled-coil protein SlyX
MNYPRAATVMARFLTTGVGHPSRVGYMTERDTPVQAWMVQRWVGITSACLLVLLTGCAQDTELQTLRANTIALERQGSTRQQTFEARMQQLSDRMARFEQAQAAARRDVAQMAATLEEFRVQLQRLQGTLQETQRQAQRSIPEEEGGASATRLSNVDTRLRALQKQLSVEP